MEEEQYHRSNQMITSMNSTYAYLPKIRQMLGSFLRFMTHIVYLLLGYKYEYILENSDETMEYLDKSRNKGDYVCSEKRLLHVCQCISLSLERADVITFSRFFRLLRTVKVDGQMFSRMDSYLYPKSRYTQCVVSFSYRSRINLHT